VAPGAALMGQEVAEQQQHAEADQHEVDDSRKIAGWGEFVRSWRRAMGVRRWNGAKLGRAKPRPMPVGRG